MGKSIQSTLLGATPLSAGGAVGAAMIMALSIAPAHALAQQAAAPASSDAPPEVVVTANRRSQNIENVPYSLSVISPKQLSEAGVTDLASLAMEVPGLSLYDYGARISGAVSPIIRGINATGDPTRAFRTFEQSPVGTYIGNSPIEGYVQLDDVKQVEVLRGPQGTLYGAGALGGALRILPNDPQLGAYHAMLEVSGGDVGHADQPSYSLDGVINIPIGDTAAFRVSTKYAYDPGFIDVHGIMETKGSGLTAQPILANPGDPLTSSGIYTSKNDWNYQKSLTSRASVLWEPTDRFRFELAYLHATVNGDGGPTVNPDFPGGASPIDPNETLPAGGKYQEYSQIDQPFSRTTDLVSFDPSYDAGFATLSATTTYQKTSGSTLEDNTYDLAGIGGGGYLPYYAGVPTNPRFIYDQLFTDHETTFAQEVRLVSKAGPKNLFDYVLGAYYEHQERTGAWTIAIPGSPEYAAAQGCTTAASGCQILATANDVNFQQIDTQHFTDASVFGEITWHVIPHGQITFGGRHFSQGFTDAQSYDDYTFPTFLPATPHKSPASRNTFKVDASYEYTTGQNVYALWSQGFRRGGANSVPLAGPFQESPKLSSYAPDSTNNYEAGLKGRLPNGLSYAADIFYIDWDKPQISSSLPSGNLAVYNANTAVSKGFEIESSGPLPFKGFAYNVSAAYADAKLTSSFSLPANIGGVITPGGISGFAGQQLPGSPKSSLSANIEYNRMLAPDYDMTISLNGTNRSPITLGLASSLGTTSVEKSTNYAIMNASAVIRHKAWRMTAYVTNLLDKQEYLAPPTQLNQVDNLTNDYVVNRPREVGLRVAYSY
jgi:outer membrane receptor protein involved in Fe transport